MSRIDNDIQLTLMDTTGENSVIIGQKIYEDIVDGEFIVYICTIINIERGGNYAI